MVVSIYKKGNKKDLGNYCPISLTCICSKVMEHVIYSCLFDHLNHFKVLQDEQHIYSFCQQRSCETQLILNAHYFALHLNQKGSMFLNFCKAFDKVPHSRIFSKLQFYGVQGSLLRWIKIFLLKFLY